MAGIDRLLKLMVEHRASDLHISAGQPPILRIRGELAALGDRPMAAISTMDLILEVLTPVQRSVLDKGQGEIDFSYDLPEVGRFRCNAYRQRRGLDAVFHKIPNSIPKLDELGFPDIVRRFCLEDQGLILVTGPRGCGKSTTQSAMIDYINSHRRRHIITVEDPIEFIHENRISLINQREVGRHTNSFAAALRQALRADPDIIQVGEMRDLETISTAITAAETGHLVLGTLHTLGAAQTIDRIIDVFPGSQKNQIRLMVSETLRGIISQQLIPIENGYAVAAEILVGTPAVSNLIRDGKSFQIPSIIQMNSRIGMQLMDDALATLVRDRKISYKTALDLSVDKKKLAQLARRGPNSQE